MARSNRKQDRGPLYGALAVVGAAFIGLGNPVVSDWLEEPPSCMTALDTAVELYEAHPGTIPPMEPEIDARCHVTDYLRDLQQNEPLGPSGPEDGQGPVAPPA